MFGIVSDSKWQLDGNIGAARKKRLQETSFESIVRQIISEAELSFFKRENNRHHPGFKRICITLAMPCKTLDLFHNGAGGYRAQFYDNVQQGERAIWMGYLLLNGKAPNILSCPIKTWM